MLKTVSDSLVNRKIRRTLFTVSEIESSLNTTIENFGV